MDERRKTQGDEAGEKASGSVEEPIAPDEAQPGDRAELGAALGGPVDIRPGAAGRGGVDRPTPGVPKRPEPEKRGGG